MNETIERSYAKLNLALDVLRRRDDGYHDLSMIMQAIDLCDIVTVRKTAADISMACDNPYIPTDERNIAYKAAKAFMGELIEPFGVDINIQKKIPIGGGLAGGSANAASVLIGLNKIANLPFDNQKLMEIGKTVGADVPFCIAAQLAEGKYCALAEGIGERLTPISPLCDVIYVLVKPKFSVSTKWVYGHLDVSKISKRPDIEQVIAGVEACDIAQIAKNTANVLEGVTIGRYPLIEKLKNDMRSHGARLSLMSGSGSTVFGVFDDKRKAYKAFEHFEKTQGFVFIC